MGLIVGEIRVYSGLSNLVICLRNVIIVVDVLGFGSAGCGLSIAYESRTCTDRAARPVVAWSLRGNDGDGTFSLQRCDSVLNVVRECMNDKRCATTLGREYLNNIPRTIQGTYFEVVTVAVPS